jgi:uncharacterized protein (DUF169 family)
MKSLNKPILADKKMEVNMRQLQTDLSVFSKLNFQFAPVGIKYLMDQPEGIEKLEQVMSMCEMPKEASQKGTPFYITKENDNCFGKLALGMEETPAFAASGLIGERFEIFQESRTNSRLYQYLPKLHKGTVNYAIFAPLEKITFEPDLLFIAASEKQLEIILRAMIYSTGVLYESTFTPVFGCSWLFIHPYQSGKVNYIPSLLEFGIMGKEIYPDNTFIISIPYHWISTIAGNLKEMKWELAAHRDGKEKFIAREQDILEEFANKYQGQS